MISSRFLHVGLFTVAIAGLALAATPADPSIAPQSQPATAPASTSASAAVGFDGWKLYRESCRQILHGNFDDAFSTIQQAVDTKAELPNLVRLKGWSDSYRDLAGQRDRLHAKEYLTYVTKIRDFAAKGEWSKAMDNMASAFWAADSEEKFRQEPWLKEIVAKAAEHAEELRRKGEWTDAARIYAELALIFPDDKTYKDLRVRCAAHAILEATYADDADWKDRLEGISPSMAHDAFWRIDRFYYTTPDLRKAAVSGLDRLIVMAETASLFKVFDGLGDPDKRATFLRGLREATGEVEKAESVSIAQLQSAFGRALAANRQTVQIPEEVLITEFVNGAFESLDRFSSMIWPAELSEFKKHTTGEFSGVGIQINMEGDRIKVFSPLEDTPAYRAGIEPGDTIVEIEGKPVKGITLEQAVRRITGEAGTEVTLTIERTGVDQPFPVTLKRAKITVPTIKGWSREGLEWDYFIDRDMKIGFVRVTSFTENTTESFQQTLKQLRQQGMNGLIVDLRMNPGGLLTTAVKMAELFLPPNKKIVETRGRASEKLEISSRSGNGEFTDIPLIILIDDYSASASEIMAGALHSHGRALLVGERTYGKGSVQNPWPLGSGDALLKLTTALYYLPGMDRSIHRDDDSKEWGVQPDVLVKLTPKEARRIGELRRQTEVLPGKSGVVPAAATAPASQPDGEEEEPEDPSLVLQVDPQVETALLLMRVRLLSKEPWSIRMASASADARKTADKAAVERTAR